MARPSSYRDEDAPFKKPRIHVRYSVHFLDVQPFRCQSFSAGFSFTASASFGSFRFFPAPHAGDRQHQKLERPKIGSQSDVTIPPEKIPHPRRTMLLILPQ